MFRFFFISIFVGQSFVSFLFAETFSWQARLQEPSFVVDVPSFWLRDYQQQTKGYVVKFFLQDSQMLLYSEKHKEELSLSQLLSAEASRLALTFDYLTFQKQGKLSHRNEVQYMSYIGYKRRKTFHVQVFVFLKKNQSLTLTCSMPLDKYPIQKAVCENAAYSFDFDTEAVAQTAVKEPISDQEKYKTESSFKKYIAELVTVVSQKNKKKQEKNSRQSSQKNKSSIKGLKSTND